MDDKRRSDTFALHFAKHFPRNCTAQQLRENIDFSILWQGNPLSCVKTFRTQKCRLCTMERLFILKLGKKHRLINRRDELYGSCKQNPKLHRFNTDDPPGEKVPTNTPVRGNSAATTQLLDGQTPMQLGNTPSIFQEPFGIQNQFPYCQTITV